MFDKKNTSFKIFGEFEFDVRWTLKQTIEKLKEYDLDYHSATSWGNLVTYRVWIESDKKYNKTKQDQWEIDFASVNPYSPITHIEYDYPNDADVLVTLKKYHQGWFRDGYYKTQGEEIKNQPITQENKN